MNSLKYMLNDLKWFDISFKSKFFRIRLEDEFRLPVSLGFTALPLRQELLLLSSAIPVLLLGLVLSRVGSVAVLIAAGGITLIWLLTYLSWRKRWVWRQLSINKAELDANTQLIFNRHCIRLPQHICGGNSTIPRVEIEKITFHWVSYFSEMQKRNRVHGVTINLHNGKHYQLSGMAYPHRSLLYLAIFFDYPVELIEQPPPRERLVIMVIALAVITSLFNLVMIAAHWH
ncbi:hypothetical protein CBX96_10055 [Shewanella sp. BC20]|uniref:hypothetical protein n=1 Tax=Shewanella sp. BC20 TaxID=2004459 RepID=UPI000D64EECA|nr:hypothetical protein [Shewanella sp. BC20]PWF63469.1 hypothetical protein CBX96_10055 [Shewanella sp. BC20]